jgi:YggT family protein
MSSANPILAYWWFHLPNLVLAALMYTALGRFVLTFIFDPDSKNYIWRFFVRLTDPVVKLVGFVTPHAVPPLVVLLFAIVWLFAARAALLLAVSLIGFAPATGAAAQ